KEADGMPCFAYDMPYGFIYGFPEVPGEGLKVAPHIVGDTVVPGASYSKITQKELEPVTRCISECIPGVRTEPKESAVCMYTMTKDSHFIIDQHPKHSNVHFASGFSGHGFKFASVIGEILSQLALQGKTEHPCGFLRLR